MTAKDGVDRNQVQHDLLFTEANNFADYISVQDIKNEELKPVWRTFQSSIESVRIMMILPQAIVSAAVDHLLPLTQATFNVLHKPVLDDSDLESASAAIAKEYSQLWRSFFDSRQLVRQAFNKNLVIYNKYNLVNSPLTKGGFFALLEAQVTGVWTAFDTLTTDLCTSVVGAKPVLLERIGDQQTTLNDLRNIGVTRPGWTGNAGDLLRAVVRFDSFQGTKQAYKKIFKDKDIDQAISSDDAAIACLIRNQITHDGGIVTNNFVRQATDKKWEPWQAAAVGELLPLDGKNVASLCRGVVECANDLVRAVDSWMKPSRPESDSK